MTDHVSAAHGVERLRELIETWRIRSSPACVLSDDKKQVYRICGGELERELDAALAAITPPAPPEDLKEVMPVDSTTMHLPRQRSIDGSVVSGASATRGAGVTPPAPQEPSDFDALLEHHRATEAENAHLRQQLAATLAKIVIVGECRNGAPHYCPNCDNSFTALQPAAAPAPAPPEDRDELQRMRAFLEREGYRRCDIPACNCGSFHKHTESAGVTPPVPREPFVYPRDSMGQALCHHGRVIACRECVDEEEAESRAEAAPLPRPEEPE